MRHGDACQEPAAHVCRDQEGALRRLAHEHPNVFPLLVVRPPETMDGIWLVEEFLKTLREAGFDPQTALYAFRALSSYASGYAIAEIRGFAMEPAGARLGAYEIIGPLGAGGHRVHSPPARARRSRARSSRPSRSR